MFKLRSIVDEEMLFNSLGFIFCFLPITVMVYFGLGNSGRDDAVKYFLIFSSLFFYSWWDVNYLPLILGSVCWNYIIGTYLSTISSASNEQQRRVFLFLGIAGNILVLGYYKYLNFLVDNINVLAGTTLSGVELVLPLAISFFTFQQIAYLVGSYNYETEGCGFSNYILFVTFFPQLIAGPIVRYSEIIPQLSGKRNTVDFNNIASGLFVFSIGLAKKVILADFFASWSTLGFDNLTTLSFFEAWRTSLSYTFQLYFDFSGYSDMAIGIALLFNIKLPINFNSPYKALSIQDFWRRWHITLSEFLRDYIYIPLGGSRVSTAKTYHNMLVTFILGGIWHGAGWTFMFWGLLHGCALCIYRVWSRVGCPLPKLLGWVITFNFINFAWIFFRATSLDRAFLVVNSMLGGKELSLEGVANLLAHGVGSPVLDWVPSLLDLVKWDFPIMMLCLAFVIVLYFPNSMQRKDMFSLTYSNALFSAVCTGLSLILLSFQTGAEFLYFNF